MKIFVLILPEIGHINPVTGIVRELVHNRNCEVIFYGRFKHKDLIESTGAKFREYKFYQDDNAILKPLKEDPYTNDISLFTNFINLSYNEIPKLIDDIETDRPELIIFDQLSISAKYLLKVMEQNFLNKKSSVPVPASVQIFTTFPNVVRVFFDKQGYKELMIEPSGLFYNFQKLVLNVKQRIFSYYFGIECSDPFDIFENFYSKLNIVTFIPEIQPFKELFDSSYEFVGNCVSENVPKEASIDDRLKKFLDIIEPVNPNYENRKTEMTLVYVSLGTVFNNNIFIFDCVIDTFKELNKIEKNFIAVIAVGSDNLNIYQKRINQGYQVPENVLILAFAPQIELLKRAKLFITHCGMNSSSEAIHYGVPVIGIPIKADQPLVAHRICDELKIGVRLNPFEINSNNLQNAIFKILNDHSYSTNIKEMSKISKNCHGSSKAAELIFNFMNSN
nr:UDP glucuronosyltransferase [Brachionus paranguensis]